MYVGLVCAWFRHEAKRCFRVSQTKFGMLSIKIMPFFFLFSRSARTMWYLAVSKSESNAIQWLLSIRSCFYRFAPENEMCLSFFVAFFCCIWQVYWYEHCTIFHEIYLNFIYLYEPNKIQRCEYSLAVCVWMCIIFSNAPFSQAMLSLVLR